MTAHRPSADAPPEPVRFHRERPAGLAVDRRQAMGWMAASMALGTTACSPPRDPAIRAWVQMPEAQAVGQPLYYASAIVRDGHAHGVLVATVEGRPIKLEGNPRHPSTLGGSDAILQAAVLQLWDPDRSMSVRRRLSPAPPAPSASAPPMATASWAAFEAAWAAESVRLDGRQGEGLHLLTGPVTSPSERAGIDALRQRWPKARWHVHAGAPRRRQREASRLAFGADLVPVWQPREATCIAALGGDPFRDGPGALRFTMDWSLAREKGRDRGGQPRLFAAECTPGLFGARADARLAREPARLEALLLRLAARWLDGVALPHGAPAVDAEEAAFEATLARALEQAGPAALLIPGAELSPEAQGLALAVNQRLGALGRGLSLVPAPDAAPGAGTLADLVEALDAGSVDTLLMLDVNPAYDGPGALGVGEALSRARLRVHAGLHADETAARCHWHLPLSHDLERWGDARGHDGTATLLQPAIAPLGDTRSALELLALWRGDAERDGRALVRRQWQRASGAASAPAHAAGFEAFWTDALRNGLVAGSAPAPVVPGPARLPASAGPVASDAAGEATPVRAQRAVLARADAQAAPPLVALFALDAAVHDGRYANLGWLQELPRPFTQVTWDSPLLLGPHTAARLGVHTGDVVRLQRADGGPHADWPAWIEPRQAEGVLTLPLGHGRWQAGRVGDAVGVDAFPLMPADGSPVAVTLHRLGTTHDFAVRQHERDQHERDLARHVRPGGRVHRDDEDLPSLYPARPDADTADRHPQWGMAIDLDACIGCGACTVACQAENNIPVVGREEVARGRVMHWIRVDRWDVAELDATLFQPVPCMHCEKAPCELVCPVEATQHDEEGLNVQVYNRCIGTRFCSNNCPYKVRRFNFLQYTDEVTATLAAQRNPDVTVRQRGVMEKCTYCLQRITRARHLEEATGRPLADGDVVTACQAACPTRAIRFGDTRDAASDVSRQKASPRNYAMLGELGTRPRTTYLARVSDRSKEG